MIELDVYFEEYDPNFSDGTAILKENLITNKIQLIVNRNLVINEIYAFINKAKKILEKRYSQVKVNICWDSLGKEE